jgi:chromosome partitioning protein
MCIHCTYTKREHLENYRSESKVKIEIIGEQNRLRAGRNMSNTKQTPKKKTASFSLSEDNVDIVEDIAKRTGRSKSEIVDSYLARAKQDMEKDASKPMIITVMSFKGGVAKTTTSANLAYELGQRGKDVLVIDLDGQGSITQYFGLYDQLAQDKCIADVLLADSRGQYMKLADVMKDTGYPGVSIVPSSFRFSDADSRMRSELTSGADTMLLFAINDMLQTLHFDYIIIDCPPSLGLVVTNAITALDAGNSNSMIVIPVRVDGFAIAGLSNTVDAINAVARGRRTAPKRWKLLATITEDRTVSFKMGVNLIKQNFEQAEFFDSKIPKAASVIESTIAMEPLCEYEPNSAPAREYRKFADEIEAINA